MNLSKKQRETLKQKFGGHCAYCGCVLGDKWHADHVEPIWRGHTKDGQAKHPERDVLENHYPACTPCNLDKAAQPVESWRERVQDKLRVLRDNNAVYRHALRFNLVTENNNPVVFYFERFV